MSTDHSDTEPFFDTPSDRLHRLERAIEEAGFGLLDLRRFSSEVEGETRLDVLLVDLDQRRSHSEDQDQEADS